MDKEQKQIEEFMDAAGKEYPKNGPQVPPNSMRKFRINFIIEELTELAKANGYELKTELIPFEHPVDHQLVDEVENADALADLIYVVKGMATSYGVDLEPIFQLVHEANMKKFGPGGYLSETGKWIKPPDWVKPDLAAELERQKNLQAVALPTKAHATATDQMILEEARKIIAEQKKFNPQPMVPERNPTDEEYDAHYAYLESCGENDRPPKVNVEFTDDPNMKYIVRHIPGSDEHRPLGKLTSDTQSFEKSLNSSNARVIGHQCFCTSPEILKVIAEEVHRGTEPGSASQETIDRMRGEDHAL